MPIQPGSTENEAEFISRCMGEETQSYPQDQSYAICKSKWDNQNMSKTSKMSAEQRVASKLAGIRLEFEIKASNSFKQEFAPEGEGVSFPWPDCIAKMLDEGYDEESANNICGMIKSEYGS